MKLFITLFVVLCLAVLGGSIYLSQHRSALSLTPTTDASPVDTSSQPKPAMAVTPESTRTVSENTNHRVKHAATSFHPNDAKPEITPEAAAFNRAIDSLVSPTTSFQDKRAMWAQLREGGQLDQAIDTLKQGATNNPTSPEYQTALGTALLQKAGVVSRSGGSVNEMGILGMSADQSFDAALKIDPANWDAQFYKAVSMSYWPAELNKGTEVVQRFSNLIDQQETMPAQPQFANSYVLLGDQYKKMGQSDNALQTYQAGAAKYPNDPTLQKKLSGK